MFFLFWIIYTCAIFPFTTWFIFEDIGANGSEMWTSTMSNEHEANVTDWDNIGLMEMFSTPASDNQFP